MTLDMFANIWLTFFSLLAVVLVNRKEEKFVKWGPVFGAISQPGWFYTAAVNHQIGVFLTALAFLGVWLDGVRLRWTSLTWRQIGSFLWRKMRDLSRLIAETFFLLREKVRR